MVLVALLRDKWTNASDVSSFAPLKTVDRQKVINLVEPVEESVLELTIVTGDVGTTG